MVRKRKNDTKNHIISHSNDSQRKQMKTLVKTLSLSIVAALISGCSSVTDVVPDEKVLNVNGNPNSDNKCDSHGLA